MKKTSLFLFLLFAVVCVFAQGSRSYSGARFSMKTHGVWGEWSEWDYSEFSCKLNYNKDKLPTDIVIRNYGLSHKGIHVIRINGYKRNGKYYPLNSFTYKFEKTTKEPTLFDDRPSSITVSKVKGKFYVCMHWGDDFGMAFYFQRYSN